MVEKVQRSHKIHLWCGRFVISRERVTVLKLYSLQRIRERYIIIYVWKILEGLAPNLSLLYVLKHRIVEGGPVSRHILMLDDWEHLIITALDGVPSVCLTNYLCLYIMPLYVLLILSRNNWISTYLQCLILCVNQDSTTAWIMVFV